MKKMTTIQSGNFLEIILDLNFVLFLITELNVWILRVFKLRALKLLLK